MLLNTLCLELPDRKDHVDRASLLSAALAFPTSFSRCLLIQFSMMWGKYFARNAEEADPTMVVTEVLRQLTPNISQTPSNIFMDGNPPKNVDTNKYLGSCINSTANLDDDASSAPKYTSVIHPRAPSSHSRI